MDKGAEVILVILLFIGLFFFFNVEAKHHKEVITTKIESMGGEVVEIDGKMFGTPYKWVSKGETIYKITYKIGDEVKIGWVKFGWKDDWRFDDEEAR